MDNTDSQLISETEAQFNTIVNTAKDDPNIVALWLGGSRGKGLVTKYSDYDLTMLVKEEVFDEYKSKYENLGNPDLELFIKTL